MNFKSQLFQFFTYNVHNKLPQDDFIKPLVIFPTDYIFICLQELDKSFQGQDTDTFDIFTKFYTDHLNLQDYILCFKQKCAGVGLLVFSKKDNPIIKIQSVSKRFQQTSCQGFIGIGFKILETSFIIIGCHLAHGGDKLDKRNEQYKIIKNLCKFQLENILPDDVENSYDQIKEYTIDNADYVILFGDTNYRVSNKQFTGKEQYLEVYEQEQLYQQIEKQVSWEDFNEMQILFQPTYKYMNQTEFEQNRTPSWCDRVIFKSNLDKTINKTLSQQEQFFKKYIHSVQYQLDHFKGIYYNSLPDLSQIDHQPVQFISQMDVYIIDQEKKSYYEIEIIKQMEEEKAQLLEQSQFQIDKQTVELYNCQINVSYGVKLEILNYLKGQLSAQIPTQFQKWLDIEIINRQMLIKFQPDINYIQTYQLKSFQPNSITIQIQNENENQERDLEVQETQDLEIKIQCQVTPFGLSLQNLENIYKNNYNIYYLGDENTKDQISILEQLLMININDQEDISNKIDQLYKIFMNMQHPALNKPISQLTTFELQIIRKILEVYYVTTNTKLIQMLFQSQVEYEQAADILREQLYQLQ